MLFLDAAVGPVIAVAGIIVILLPIIVIIGLVLIIRTIRKNRKRDNEE